MTEGHGSNAHRYFFFLFSCNSSTPQTFLRLTNMNNTRTSELYKMHFAAVVPHYKATNKALN